MRSGEIYRIPDFYLDPIPVYLLVLAIYPHGDLVARLLSQASD